MSPLCLLSHDLGSPAGRTYNACLIHGAILVINTHYVHSNFMFLRVFISVEV